jgi:hypothetical protein
LNSKLNCLVISCGNKPKETIMKRIVLAALTSLTVVAALPASASTGIVDFPTLTFPPKPAPETTQGGADLTTRNGETCTRPSE